MSTGEPDTVLAAPERLRSLDVLRGLVILAMLFVNDIAGVSGTPGWLKHAGAHANRMTFVDLVFPAFLFMVGMALPLALGRRLAKGESLVRLWSHIAIRTLGLLALGLFTVVAESPQPGGLLSPAAWTLAGYLGVVLVWNTYDAWKERYPRRVHAFRLVGGLLLLAVLAIYHGPTGSGFSALKPGWWGILGLIGWGYVAACAVYVPGRRHPEAILGGLALFGLVTLGAPFLLGTQPGWLAGIMTASAPHGLIVLAGALLGMMLQAQPGVMPRVRWTLAFAAGLYLASLLLNGLAPLHEVFSVSKILGTPAWCLRCSAYTALLWLLIYLMVDVAGRIRGTRFLAEAGGNALFAYLLAPILVALWELTLGYMKGYDTLGTTFFVGFLRAAGAALLLTWLAGFLRRQGLNLKL